VIVGPVRRVVSTAALMMVDLLLSVIVGLVLA